MAVVAALYLFLFAAVRVVWREFRRESQGPAQADHGARLEIVDPARTRLPAGDAIPLHQALSIGRERGNDLIVDEDTVSGQHARLVQRDGRWWIEDLNSTNGTLVNAHSIAGSRQLKPGDIIQIGRVSLRFAR